MNFKEYDKIIKEHKYDMLFMIIYYNLQCNENFKQLDENDIKELIHFIHYTYLKDENYIDLGHICDVALTHKDDIINDKFTKWDLLKVCYE